MPWTDVDVVPLLFVARTKVEYGFYYDSGANSVDRHSTAAGSLRSFDMAILIWSELKKGISSRKRQVRVVIVFHVGSLSQLEVRLVKQAAQSCQWHQLQ